MACKHMEVVAHDDCETFQCGMDGSPCGHPHDNNCLKFEWTEETNNNNEERKE